MAGARVSGRLWRLLAASGLFLAATGGSPAAAQLGPAPTPSGLPPDVLGLACAPMPAFAPPAVGLQVTGAQDGVERRSFGPGDLLVINAGENQGITVGQQFFARRMTTFQRGRPSRERPGVIQTTGWVRVYAVGENMSLATIAHACDVVSKGDYLEPFVIPTVPTAPPRDLDKVRHDTYGHVLVGVEQTTTFGRGSFFLIDRGANEGVTPGTRFVVYRDKHEPGVFLFEVGDAVAMSVQDDTATLLVLRARDAMLSGDYVAIQK